MLDKLTFEENNILELFFVLFPQWKHNICQQIIDSEITRHDDISNRSTCFVLTGKNTKPINIKHRVPVEIIIGEIQISDEYLIKESEDNRINIVLPGSYIIQPDAVGIQLHFNNGIIEELEIYNLDGNKLNFPINTNNIRTYIISEKELLEQIIQ